MGVEVLALLLGILLLVGGAYVFFKQLMALRLSSIEAILVWLVMVVVIITYAEQHDDPWELYVGSIATASASAIAGALAALKIVMNKFTSLEGKFSTLETNLNQRFAEHVASNSRLFEQFEKRFMEKLDGMAKSGRM